VDNVVDNVPERDDERVYDILDLDESDLAYFAAMDQVLSTDEHDDVQVRNGWASALWPTEEADRRAVGSQPGDQALADAVKRQLREDALTTTLAIEVEVVSGIVWLRGQVAALQDAEAAGAVASQVAGVREVLDELDVRANHHRSLSSS
jgi:osmotically-inducible protein OsmY